MTESGQLGLFEVISKIVHEKSECGNVFGGVEGSQ